MSLTSYRVRLFETYRALVPTLVVEFPAKSRRAARRHAHAAALLAGCAFWTVEG
ncbi:hypothetical protein [Roseomonas sp. WA12]